MDLCASLWVAPVSGLSATPFAGSCADLLADSACPQAEGTTDKSVSVGDDGSLHLQQHKHARDAAAGAGAVPAASDDDGDSGGSSGHRRKKQLPTRDAAAAAAQALAQEQGQQHHALQLLLQQQQTSAPQMQLAGLPPVSDAVMSDIGAMLPPSDGPHAHAVMGPPPPRAPYHPVLLGPPHGVGDVVSAAAAAAVSGGAMQHVPQLLAGGPQPLPPPSDASNAAAAAAAAAVLPTWPPLSLQQALSTAGLAMPLPGAVHNSGGGEGGLAQACSTLAPPLCARPSVRASVSLLARPCPCLDAVLYLPIAPRR